MIIDSKDALNRVVAAFRAILEQHRKVKLATAHQLFAKSVGYNTQAALIADLPVELNNRTSVDASHVLSLLGKPSLPEGATIPELFPFTLDIVKATAAEQIAFLDTLILHCDSNDSIEQYNFFKQYREVDLLKGLGGAVAECLLAGDNKNASLLVERWLTLKEHTYSPLVSAGTSAGLIFLAEHNAPKAALHKFEQIFYPIEIAEYHSGLTDAYFEAYSHFVKSSALTEFLYLFEHGDKSCSLDAKMAVLHFSYESNEETIKPIVDAILARKGINNVDWMPDFLTDPLKHTESKNLIKQILRLKPPVPLVRHALINLPAFISGPNFVDVAHQHIETLFEYAGKRAKFTQDERETLNRAFATIADSKDVVERFKLLQTICNKFDAHWTIAGINTIINLIPGSRKWPHELKESNPMCLVHAAQELFELGVDSPEPESDYALAITGNPAIHHPYLGFFGGDMLTINFIVYMNYERDVKPSQRLVAELLIDEANCAEPIENGHRAPDTFKVDVRKAFPIMALVADEFNLNLSDKYLDDIVTQHAYRGNGEAIRFIEQLTYFNVNKLFSLFPENNKLHSYTLKTAHKTLIPALLQASVSTQRLRNVVANALLTYLGKDVVEAAASGSAKHRELFDKWLSSEYCSGGYSLGYRW